jgi:hypothetical protein
LTNFSKDFYHWLLVGHNEAQRFVYGLWRFRSTFLSTENKAGYEAKTLLEAVRPP